MVAPTGVVAALVAAGADTGAKSGNLLFLETLLSQIEVTETRPCTLLPGSLKFRATTGNGNSPLHFAASWGREHIVGLLLEKVNPKPKP